MTKTLNVALLLCLTGCGRDPEIQLPAAPNYWEPIVDHFLPRYDVAIDAGGTMWTDLAVSAVARRGTQSLRGARAVDSGQLKNQLHVWAGGRGPSLVVLSLSGELKCRALFPALESLVAFRVPTACMILSGGGRLTAVSFSLCPPAKLDEPIIVECLADGAVVNGHARSDATLHEMMNYLHSGNAKVQVIVVPSDGVTVQRLVNVVCACSSAAAENVYLLRQTPASAPLGTQSIAPADGQ